MFSFHKPRVYRSTEGCCICRAKSSSSRFTDSKKYEDDSMKCFNLEKPRQGEICNACVLLVKRFKRLPAGSNRHWGHVVDARVGPGMKSMTKFKKLREENERIDTRTQKNNFPEKFSKIFKKKKGIDKFNLDRTPEHTNDLSYWNNIDQSFSPLTNSENVEFNDIQSQKFQKKINRRKLYKPRKNITLRNISFIDEAMWKFRKICCGFAYEHALINALIFDIANFKPCKDHSNPTKLKYNLSQKQYKAENDIYINNNSNKNITTENNAQQSNLIVLKKHNMFQKRQSGLTEQTGLAVVSQIECDKLLANKNILPKNKLDSEKLTKNLINKVNLSTRFNPNDPNKIINSVENLRLKIIENKSILVQNKSVTDLPTSKFSDNSSDSGFDENMLDRKSISPVNDENEKGSVVRANQKMFLSNGIYIQGQQQNLILTGNEFASKILQRRLSRLNSSKY